MKRNSMELAAAPAALHQAKKTKECGPAAMACPTPVSLCAPTTSMASNCAVPSAQQQQQQQCQQPPAAAAGAPGSITPASLMNSGWTYPQMPMGMMPPCMPFPSFTGMPFFNPFAMGAMGAMPFPFWMPAAAAAANAAMMMQGNMMQQQQQQQQSQAGIAQQQQQAPQPCMSFQQQAVCAPNGSYCRAPAVPPTASMAQPASSSCGPEMSCAPSVSCPAMPASALAAAYASTGATKPSNTAAAGAPADAKTAGGMALPGGHDQQAAAGLLPSEVCSPSINTDSSNDATDDEFHCFIDNLLTTDGVAGSSADLLELAGGAGGADADLQLCDLGKDAAVAGLARNDSLFDLLGVVMPGMDDAF